MPTVTITISAGFPSKHYPPDERKRNGATDFDVSINVGLVFPVRGGITLYTDPVRGGLSSCGSPTEVWMSTPIIHFLDGLTLEQRSAVLTLLESGTGRQLELALAPPHELGSRVEDLEDDTDAGKVLGVTLTERGWRLEIGWDTGVRTTVGPDEIRAER